MKPYLCILFSLGAALAAEIPEAYSTVERIIFVVPDADRAAQAWAKTGVPVVRAETLDLRAVKGEATRVRMSSAFFENVTADFIQPLSSVGPFADYLKRTKGGGMALVHALPDVNALNAELKRLADAGAAVVMDATFGNGARSDRYVFLDTAREGKYTLALTAVSNRKPASARRRVVQYAFAVRDLEAISAYWAKLGLPPMTYTHPDTSELVYRSKPGVFDMKLGWQRHGKVPYEWIQPLRGPSTYHEHIEKHGEGFHHLAFNVNDMDEGIKEWSAFGFPFVMGGAWGVKGQAGSGRFAYHDLDACCGSEVELLWNYKGK